VFGALVAVAVTGGGSLVIVNSPDCAFAQNALRLTKQMTARLRVVPDLCIGLLFGLTFGLVANDKLCSAPHMPGRKVRKDGEWTANEGPECGKGSGMNKCIFTFMRVPDMHLFIPDPFWWDFFA